MIRKRLEVDRGRSKIPIQGFPRQIKYIKRSILQSLYVYCRYAFQTKLIDLIDQASMEELEALETKLNERKFALGVGMFNEGKIYKITLDDVVVYVGSTVRSLETRWAGHKGHFWILRNKWSGSCTDSSGSGLQGYETYYYYVIRRHLMRNEIKTFCIHHAWYE